MNIFKKLSQAFADYRNYRNTVAELSGLSDHMLADLGLLRAEIKAVASGELNIRARRIANYDQAKARASAVILPINANTVLATNIGQLKPVSKAA